MSQNVFIEGDLNADVDSSSSSESESEDEQDEQVEYTANHRRYAADDDDEEEIEVFRDGQSLNPNPKGALSSQQAPGKQSQL